MFAAMAEPGLRTTVVMKTDLRGSTPHFRALPEADLSAVLAAHRKLVADVAAKHQGEIVKPEGDAFWIVFPSVTAACLAGLDMQDELRLAQPGRGDDRLAMRIVVTLGDVQIEEGALVGDPVVLAARIEAITPPDEIYLSLSAWLAVKSAEVRTTSVGAFPMKGFDELVPVHRVESRHRTRVFRDQYIVASDLSSFGTFLETHDLPEVERLLDDLLEAVQAVCHEFDGTTRFSTGDSYFLTFDDPAAALAAVERLWEIWAEPAAGGRHCPLRLAVHRGTVFAYRSYVHGVDVDVAFVAQAVAREAGIYVTDVVAAALAGTGWEARLRPVEELRTSSRLRGHGLYRLAPAGGP